MFAARSVFLRLRSFAPLINISNVIQPRRITSPILQNARRYSSAIWSATPTQSALLQTRPTIITCNPPSSVRTVTKFTLRKGKRRPVRVVIRKFYRLGWGGWIRTIAGRHSKLYRKKARRRLRLKRHVLCNATQSRLLDSMVGSYWRRRRFFVDDPYEPYHTREEFRYTARKPRPFIPYEDRM